MKLEKGTRIKFIISFFMIHLPKFVKTQFISQKEIGINLAEWDKTISFDQGYVTYVILQEDESVNLF